MTGPEPIELDASRYTHSEAALGGADAVEKTSYVTGKGTDPQATSTGKPTASVGSGGGLGGLGWAIGALVVLGGIALFLGMVG